VRRVLRRARQVIGDDPLFLPIVLRATPTGTVRRITPETDIVIEGFPRSGNTFAYFALRHAAGDDLVISSHVHTPSQVKLAVSERFPTLVVIRQPMDTITSLLIAAPHVPFESAIKEYIHHHREIFPLRDRFVIGSFDDVTKDFGAVTERINERFGTSFPLFANTEEDVEAVFAAIEENHRVLHGGTENVVPRPSEARKAEKAWLVEQLSKKPYRTLMAEAEGVYTDFLAARDEG
jgi:hypothetical protein